MEKGAERAVHQLTAKAPPANGGTRDVRVRPCDFREPLGPKLRSRAPRRHRSSDADEGSRYRGGTHHARPFACAATGFNCLQRATSALSMRSPGAVTR